MDKNGDPETRADAAAALGWAAAGARLRGSRLLVVHAWTPIYADVQRAAEELLAKATAGLDAEGVEIECRAVEGGAPDVLVREAAEADLLVVGSRGHGGFTGLLLGSVGQQCAHHAHCPVVIVPPSKQAATESDLAAAGVTRTQARA